MLPRHSLAWLTPAGWREAALSANPECAPLLEEWEREGLPLIVRRQEPDLDARWCCLGLALPPDPATGNKRRIPLRAAVANLRRVSGPLPLAQVVAAAPAGWRPALAELDQRAAEQGMVPRVYGSLALQHLTGKTYLTEASDIDLLLTPSSAAQLQAGITLLSGFAGILPLDGEIVFHDGVAVAWKEWLAATRNPGGISVLTKSPRGVTLRKPHELLATLGDAACLS